MYNLKPSLFAYHDLIAAITAAVEARDYHTAHHSERVSNMAEYVCHLVGLSRQETTLIHLAADLHDIGKIGIPDRILLKDGPLTDAEWVEMKSHPCIGDRILRKVDRFKEIAVIVRHHHERWDGKGYPDKIAGTDIPLGARIIAVADSVDAMLSDRAYRRGMSPADCKNEISANRGVMYDPAVTQIVLNHWDTVLACRYKQWTNHRENVG